MKGCIGLGDLPILFIIILVLERNDFKTVLAMYLLLVNDVFALELAMKFPVSIEILGLTCGNGFYIKLMY